jgi:hypothetical protein
MGGTCYGLAVEIPFHIAAYGIGTAPVPLESVHVAWDTEPFQTDAVHDKWAGGDETTPPVPEALDKIELEGG